MIRAMMTELIQKIFLEVNVTTVYCDLKTKEEVESLIKVRMISKKNIFFEVHSKAIPNSPII